MSHFISPICTLEIYSDRKIVFFETLCFNSLALSDSQFSDGKIICSADEGVRSTIVVAWESSEHTRSYACLYRVCAFSLET